VITSGDLDRAASIVEATRDYLPFDYTTDGCYARATYMQMELLAADIPSRVVFVRTALNAQGDDFDGAAPTLRPVAWSWHVAPVVKVDGVEWVLDPSVSPLEGGKTPLDRWLKFVAGKNVVEAPLDELHQQVVEEAGKFIASRATSSQTDLFKIRNVREMVIKTTAEMEPFDRDTFLWEYWTLDQYTREAVTLRNLPSTERDERRERLLNRTLELAFALQVKGLIKGAGGDLEGTKITRDMLLEIRERDEYNP
jgi:hypothetical protein